MNDRRFAIGGAQNSAYRPALDLPIWQYGNINNVTDEMKKDDEITKVNETIEIDQDNL